ncbi:hypothetical protein [Limnoglobus roseus]|nr:hypothetical protein [Limnoglobus roseus]
MLGGGVVLTLVALGIVYAISKRGGRDMKDSGEVAQAPAHSPPAKAAEPPPPADNRPWKWGTALPAGWEKFNDPLGGIEAYFPDGQPQRDENAGVTLGHDHRIAGEAWAKTRGDKTYELLRSPIPENALNRGILVYLGFTAIDMRATRPGSKVTKMESTVGYDSVYVFVDVPGENKRLVSRLAVAGGQLVEARVTGPPTMSEKDDDVKPFIENFLPTSVAADLAPRSDKLPVGVPAGWEKFRDPLNEVILYFPERPKKDTARRRDDPPDSEEWNAVNNLKYYALIRWTVEANGEKPEKVLFDAMNAYLRKQSSVQGPATFEPPMLEQNGRVSRVGKVDYGSNGKLIFRGIVSGNRVLIAIYSGSRMNERTDPEVQPFLDNFEALK